MTVEASSLYSPGEKIYDPVATEKHTNVSQQHSFRHQEHHLIHETDITFSGNLRENSLRHHGDGELHQMQYLIRHIIDGDLRHPQEGPDHQLVYIHVNLCGQTRHEQRETLLISRSQFPHRYHGQFLFSPFPTQYIKTNSRPI